ncbi:MAG: hypothetical protein P9M03_09035 [Candidatus Theseobacter exili]|nr:hypothetical protein [Candidatus Theseobacter exili]
MLHRVLLKKIILIVLFVVFLAPVLHAQAIKDKTCDELITTILDYQLESGLVPFSVEDNVKTGNDYSWGLWMMALVAAERNGYILREEAIKRIEKLLSTVDTLKKHKGLLYWHYNLKTLEPNGVTLGFQGWFLYSLIVIKNAYPELTDRIDKHLSAIDYSDMYDEKERFLADYNVEEDKKEWRIPLGPISDGSDAGQPASERRVAYFVYSYLTGDLSPWLLNSPPAFQEVEGYKLLSVWAHYNFDIAHLHYVLPEIGYYEKSWRNFLASSQSFMEKSHLKFFPIRQGTLEEGLWNPMSPNTEHRETMPWITWYLNPKSPVMEYCFRPDYGLFRYYDNWDFYWSYGKEMIANGSIGSRKGKEDVADSYQKFRFFMNRSPLFTRPPRINKLWLYASYPDEKNPPLGNLDVYLNEKKIIEIKPEELSTKPVRIEKVLGLDLRSVNEIELKNNNLKIVDFNRYDLYRHEKSVTKIEYGYRKPERNAFEGPRGLQYSLYGEKVANRKFPGSLVGVSCEGQNIGPAVEDTCTAFLIRVGVIHGYYVWKEMKNDQKYWDNTVAWVGDYYNKADRARWVRNVSDTDIKVNYERPGTWKDSKSIKVMNTTEKTDVSSQLSVTENNIQWPAKAWHTYEITYKNR